VKGRGLALALRIVAGLLLVAALVWSHVGGEDRGSTVLVVDRSASIDDAQAAQQRAWIRAAIEHGVCGDPCRVVAFAGQATFAGATADRDTAAPAPQATDLEAALRLAAGSADRAIVLSDGLATSGDAATAGLRVDAVPLTAPSQGRDAAVARLSAGSPLHAGDPLTLQATITSTVAANARVELTRDGAAIARQTLNLRAGETPLLLTPDPPSEGWHAYRLRVELDGDEQAANDALDATTRIGPPPNVLVIGDAGDIPGLLSADGMRVQTRATLPDTAAGYADTDVVLLADVPARQLSDAQQQTLRTAVEDGTGLFVLGGERSLSLGGYAGTPLDAILPVQSLKPGGVRKRKLALELVIDRSSSMNDLAGAGTDSKIEMARAAARSALTLAARDEDELGIVAFDAQPHDILPLQRVSAANAAAVGAQLDALDAGGGTNLLRGLQRGADQIAASRAPTRHIVLISDGVSEPGDPAALLRRLNDEHITLSTIALGPDADVDLLRRMARDGRGTFVAVPDARDLPKVLARETRRVAPAVAQRARLTVSPGAASPITSPLSGQPLPPLTGNVLTRLRGGAIAPLTTQINSTTAPVLAQWQVGLGRVAVWTPGAGAFAGDWPTQRPQLFTAAARWVERGVPTPALQPALDPADRSRVVVDPQSTADEPLPLADLSGTVRRPDATTDPLEFAALAPSRYAASLGDDPAPGVYGTGVSDGVASAQALLAVPYPAEFAPRPADASVLGALAAATGGDVLDVTNPDAALAPDDGFALWRVLVGAALLTFLAAVALAMRRAR
jgi:hypothetical protein